jgi:hypothetical protein
MPIFAYFVLAFSSALVASYKNKKGYYLIVLPFLYLIMHFSYGFGTIRGLVNGILASPQAEKRVSEVKLVRIKAFGEQCAE